jgi:ABC-type bacteriocin/lantibiotic exporter with double-glycine peptidase domain
MDKQKETLEDLIKQNTNNIEYYKTLETQIREVESEKEKVQQEYTKIKEEKEKMRIVRQKLAAMKLDLEKEKKEFEEQKEQKQEQKEKQQSLRFHQLRFENVSFQYDRGTEPVLQNVSLTIPTDNHQIVGIIGVSGRGKSTLMKLLLRLHACQEGSVYVDDVNVQDIDPDFLRQQIVYVPQSGKLFDRKVKENIFYGCQDVPYCDKHLTYLMQYPKLRELFEGIDFETKDAGALGENLSGGQRQIVNMLSGLVSPAKILVLDEPTNALDPELKQEVLALMDAYRVHKNAILIITHDRDLDGLFDQVVRMDE